VVDAVGRGQDVQRPRGRRGRAQQERGGGGREERARYGPTESESKWTVESSSYSPIDPAGSGFGSV
jgi:hypothetical protein